MHIIKSIYIFIIHFFIVTTILLNTNIEVENETIFEYPNWEMRINKKSFDEESETFSIFIKSYLMNYEIYGNIIAPKNILENNNELKNVTFFIHSLLENKWGPNKIYKQIAYQLLHTKYGSNVSILIDLPNHGKSKIIDNGLSSLTQTTILKDIIKHINLIYKIRNTSFIGHGYGSLIASELSSICIETNKLILISPFFGSEAFSTLDKTYTNFAKYMFKLHNISWLNRTINTIASYYSVDTDVINIFKKKKISDNFFKDVKEHSAKKSSILNAKKKLKILMILPEKDEYLNAKHHELYEKYNNNLLKKTIKNGSHFFDNKNSQNLLIKQIYLFYC